MPELNRRRVEGSKQLQGPSTPDRGASDGQPSNPITITPPSVDILRSLCATEHRKGCQSQACIFHGLELPAGHAGNLTMDFLGGAMPSLVEVQADQPRNIGGKRKTYGGTAKKHKRAKMDKLPLDAADTAKLPDSSTFQGAIDVPVVLVPSLAVFSRPVQTMPVPVEVQPATAKEVSQKDNSNACLVSRPPDNACKPGFTKELSQGTNNDAPSSSAPPNSAPVPKQLSTSSADKPASCDKDAGPHQLPADLAEYSAFGDKKPANGQGPASSSDEAGSAKEEDTPGQLPANLSDEPACGSKEHVPPQVPASLADKSASCDEDSVPKQLPASSPNEPASVIADHPLNVGAAVPLEVPAPPCPSTREARRASAPAILASQPQQYLAAYEAAVAQGGAPEVPLRTQANAITAPQDSPLPPVDEGIEQPQGDLQPHEAPAIDRADSAPVPEVTNAEGVSVGDAAALCPASLPILAAPHEDSALDEPGTPTGQDGNAPGATFASAALSPHPGSTQRLPTQSKGRAESTGMALGDQEWHHETQVAYASPEGQSLDAESFLHAAPSAHAPDPVQHASTAADHGCSSSSGSSKNGRPLASEGRPASDRVTGAQVQAADLCSTPPTSRQLDQGRGGLPLFKESVQPLTFPLSNAELPCQRQNGSFPAGPEVRSYDMHGPPAMWAETGGTPLHAGNSQQQRFKQQKEQLLSAQSGAEEPDAFGPLLGPILGMDIGADPITMEEDLARFDRDLANAWHQETFDMRATIGEPRKFSFGQQLGRQEMPQSSHPHNRRLSIPSAWAPSAIPQLFLTPSSRHAQGNGFATRMSQAHALLPFSGHPLPQQAAVVNGLQGGSPIASVPPNMAQRSTVPDLEVLELRQLGANLQRLLCLNLSCVDDAMGDPAGVAASQSLLLLLETLQRIPVTWQLLQQSQIAVCVRACCQHGNKQVAMTARHLLEKWQLAIEATGPNQSSSKDPQHEPMQHSAPYIRGQRQPWQQPRGSPLSQAQLFSEHMQVCGSMSPVDGPTARVGTTQDAGAVGLTSFPDLGSGGLPLDAAQSGGHYMAEGDGPGGPGRMARSASSRPAQAARYASSPKVLWPDPAPLVPLTRAATVDTVPQLVLGGGRARPRPQASGRGAGTFAGTTAGTAAKYGRQAYKQRKPAKKAKKAPGGPPTNFPLGRHGGTGIAALERQLQQLKATAAYDDLAWSKDLEPMPATNAISNAPQNTQPVAASAPEFQGCAAGTSRRGHRPASFHQETPNETGMHGTQDHAFWAKPPGVDMSPGSGRDSDRDPDNVLDEEQEEEEPCHTKNEARSSQRDMQDGIARRRTTRAAGRAGRSAETGQDTTTTTTSTTDEAGSSKTRPTTWTDQEKARYIAVLQLHGRNLKRLCAAFPHKSSSAVSKFYSNNKQRLRLDRVLLEAGFSEKLL
ncbi:g9079 [Coccomyxa elongata]